MSCEVKNPTGALPELGADTPILYTTGSPHLPETLTKSHLILQRDASGTVSSDGVTNEEKDVFLNMFNSRRSNMFPPAARMVKLVGRKEGRNLLYLTEINTIQNICGKSVVRLPLRQSLCRYRGSHSRVTMLK